MTDADRIAQLEKEVARLRSSVDTLLQMVWFLSASAGRLEGKALETDAWLWEIAAALGQTWEYEHGCMFEHPHLTPVEERE